VWAICFVLVASVGNAQQRDSARAGVARPTAAAPDTLVTRLKSPPVTARRAFLYSFFFPGLGQSALDRPTAGALFFTIEAVALGMLGKSMHDLYEAERFARDSVALRFKVDSTGRVARKLNTDTLQFDPAPNRYGGTPSYVAARRTHVEDWLAVLLFNHLLAGADAFVAAQLWDLPGEVQLRVYPGEARLRVPKTR
jgi:hypothetical protein